MAIQVRAHNNGDHVAVAWLPDDRAPIPECRGFTVKRLLDGEEWYLHSFVGFHDGDKIPSDAPWKWPIQRYMWWDYNVSPGDTVKYQVIPVTGTVDPDTLKLEKDLASDWTEELTVTPQFTEHVSAFFNKGIVAAQWVARELERQAPGVAGKTALNDLIKKLDNPLREKLAGLLKPAVLDVIAGGGEGSLYAALYELGDPELINGLVRLGPKANVILANGAFSDDEPDENAEARKDLKDNSEVHVSDRMVHSPHFAHNKFAVVCDAGGAAKKVLSGSTNWTSTGLCTQANNGLVIEDDQVADRFLTQWKRLKDAGDGYPPELEADNSKLEQFQVDGMTVTPWFAPTEHEQDMDFARERIANAKEGILFLFFNPGAYQEDPRMETLLQNVLDRQGSDLYLRGVVNQAIKGLTDKRVTLVGKTEDRELPEEVLVPANVKERYHTWENEPLGASRVMVHSKVVVIDPLGDHPVLMTGSHNLGVKASSKNDDNLVILEGPAAAPLATAYAVNIIAIYEAYRWNSYATRHQLDKDAWHGLEDNATWQDGRLTGEKLDEILFWTGQGVAAPQQ